MIGSEPIEVFGSVTGKSEPPGKPREPSFAEPPDIEVLGGAPSCEPSFVPNIEVLGGAPGHSRDPSFAVSENSVIPSNRGKAKAAPCLDVDDEGLARMMAQEYEDTMQIAADRRLAEELQNAIGSTSSTRGLPPSPVAAAAKVDGFGDENGAAFPELRAPGENAEAVLTPLVRRVARCCETHILRSPAQAC